MIISLIILTLSWPMSASGTDEGPEPSEPSALSSDLLECKSIIAKGEATPGEYTLHMKIRDPSRPGGQVLFICEPGYEYTYHHPTTGEPMHFTVTNRVIGVATSGDTPPNIMKAGMALTDKGISYGDNDINLLYCNPSQYAWDDFDWLRYGYQTADSEDSSVELLLDAVYDLHATGKGEALYVVGPDHAYVIEANAREAAVEEIDEIYVRTNYAVKLWETATRERYLYGPHFESLFDGWVRKGETVKLGQGCAYGIIVEDINDDNVRIRSIHGNSESLELKLDEVKTLCDFRVGLKEIKNGPLPQARISLCYHYLEWKERMESMVMREHGNITEAHMMGWSRLHEGDIGGLRPMCEGSSVNCESVSIFKIPGSDPGTMSSFWYTCYPCASIYVPVHICVEEIYEPYLTEEACSISREMFDARGHNNDTALFERVESVFINENNRMEFLASGLLAGDRCDIVPQLLTHSDMMMQKHALLTLRLYLMMEAEDAGPLRCTLENTWRDNYVDTFTGLKESLSLIVQEKRDGGSGSDACEEMIDIILDIADTAAYHAIEGAKCMEGEETDGIKKALDLYNRAREDVDSGSPMEGMDGFEKAFLVARCIMNGEDYSAIIEESGGVNHLILCSITAVVIAVILLVVFIRRSKKRT